MNKVKIKFQTYNTIVKDKIIELKRYKTYTPKTITIGERK